MSHFRFEAIGTTGTEEMEGNSNRDAFLALIASVHQDPFEFQFPTDSTTFGTIGSGSHNDFNYANQSQDESSVS